MPHRLAGAAGVAAVDRFERRTEWPLAILALVFLVAYAWPILDPSLGPGWKHACTLTALVIWALFAAEFLCRLVLSDRRGAYALKHIPDLLMVALPVLRPLRLLRFLVLLRMINRRATVSLRGRVVVYIVASATLVLFIAALAMLDAERGHPNANISTFGDALWWAVSTMSTVGYGDLYPTTSDGRYIGAGLMIAGIALLGAVTASIAAWQIAQVRAVETEAQAATRGDIAELRAELAPPHDRPRATRPRPPYPRAHAAAVLLMTPAESPTARARPRTRRQETSDASVPMYWRSQ